MPQTTPEDYERAERILLDALWQWVAEHDRTLTLKSLTYGQVSRLVDMYWYAGNFFNLLDRIDEHIPDGGPMITSLVVNRNGEPGKRFFRTARELGHVFTDERGFWEGQREASTAWIRSHPNYPSTRD